MCVAVPGRIINIDRKMAKADFMGVYKDVNIEMIHDIKIGDYVMVHAGFAIEKLQTQEAKEILDALKELEFFEEDK